MVIHAKDIAKVVGAASTNIVTSAAASAVQGPVVCAPIPCSEKLHVVLVVLQIAVALVTGAYISLKTYRLWKNKNAPA